LEAIRSKLIDAANELSFNILENYFYDTIKDLFTQVQYLIAGAKREMLSDIAESKKTPKYPQLLKPAYYPEIDTLNISDVRTVEIHVFQFLKAIWRNIKRYFIGGE
jgi:hypothetical protein